jgi:hypothetical protein
VKLNSIPCKVCGKSFTKSSMGGHVASAHTNKNQKCVLRRITVYKTCKGCGIPFPVVRKIGKDGVVHIPKKELIFHNLSCSNAFHYKVFAQNEQSKKKISDGLKRNFDKEVAAGRKKPREYCKSCGKQIARGSKTGLCWNCFLSSDDAKRVLRTGAINGGSTCAKHPVSRSKNEKYFAQLCKKEFQNVECNKRIFNGWDADVVIHDCKIAILWNGPWHYRQIGKSHLSEIQNRDKIKTHEIEKMGYVPYVVRDDARRNGEKFVESEFEKLLAYITSVGMEKWRLTRPITSESEGFESLACHLHLAG